MDNSNTINETSTNNQSSQGIRIDKQSMPNHKTFWITLQELCGRIWIIYFVEKLFPSNAHLWKSISVSQENLYIYMYMRLFTAHPCSSDHVHVWTALTDNTVLAHYMSHMSFMDPASLTCTLNTFGLLVRLNKAVDTPCSVIPGSSRGIRSTLRVVMCVL